MQLQPVILGLGLKAKIFGLSAHGLGLAILGLGLALSGLGIAPSGLVNITGVQSFILNYSLTCTLALSFLFKQRIFPCF